MAAGMTPAARGKRVFEETCVRDQEGAWANDRLPVDTADALASGFLPADFAGYLPGDSTTCTEMSGNGVLIGTLRRTTRSALRRIPSGRFKAIPGYSEGGDGRVAQPVVAARHVWAIRLQWVTQTPGFAC